MESYGYHFFTSNCCLCFTSYIDNYTKKYDFSSKNVLFSFRSFRIQAKLFRTCFLISKSPGIFFPLNQMPTPRLPVCQQQDHTSCSLCLKTLKVSFIPPFISPFFPSAFSLLSFFNNVTHPH